MSSHDTKHLRQDLVLRSYDGEGARNIQDTVIVPVYQSCHADNIARDPFYSIERYLQRFHGYSSAPGFAMITANDETSVLGYIFGYTLQPGARWWNGLVTPVPEGFTTEDGGRTFAINELMTLERARRRGIATALHDELLGGRHEQRATLLVDPDNDPAKAAYLSWGWKVIGQLQPFPDSPRYDSMVRELPL